MYLRNICLLSVLILSELLPLSLIHPYSVEWDYKALYTLDVAM